MTNYTFDKRHSISVVLPAYNEEENITEAIRITRKTLYKYFDKVEIIVVNDGSVDQTPRLINELIRDTSDVRVIHHDKNRGYGAALKSGFINAENELIFFTDSDLQFDIDEIIHLLPFIKTFDIVSGYRDKRADSSLRRFNAWAWNKLVRILLGIKAKDIDCAFKLFRKDVLDALSLSSEGAMINTEILALAKKYNYSFQEVPVTHFPRTRGEQTGANIGVVYKAFSELFTMYNSLK
jgi:glycosyltransferase involved in cell wall biosynthesis